MPTPPSPSSTPPYLTSPEHTLRADIVVSGVGRPGIIQLDMIREGAVVASAGISWQGKPILSDVAESVAVYSVEFATECISSSVAFAHRW